MADILQLPIPKDPRVAKFVYAFIKRFQAQDKLNDANLATHEAMRNYYDLQIAALKTEIHKLKYQDNM